MSLRPRTLRLALALAPLALASRTALAQAIPSSGTVADSLADGRRVRVTLPMRGFALGSPRVEGAFRSMDADSLRLVVGGRDTSFALAHVQRLEVRVHHGNRQRNVIKGAVGGALFGGIAAYVFVSTMDPCSHSGDEMQLWCVDDPAHARAVSAAVGAAAWSAIGAAVGALTPTHRWQRLSHERRVGLILGPGGVGLALRR